MNWLEAKAKIKGSLRVGTDLNTAKSHYRFVNAIEEQGFIIPIGKSNNLRISWEMLEQCFQAFSGEVYDGDYFRKLYPTHAAHHPCYVHVIGQIFVAAGLAYFDNGKYIQKQ